MEKITIFTIPKPFTGHVGIIQRNAIQSWLNITPEPDVILFGDDAGVAETSEEFGVVHVPHIPRNRHGTPYIDVVFGLAQVFTGNGIMCYINADNLLFPEFMKSIEQIRKFQSASWKQNEAGWIISKGVDFLVTGQRLNVDITTPVDTNSADVLDFIMKNHTRQPFPGLDYFIFPRGMVHSMPAFVVGRAGWDNWLIYDARRRGIPVIDASLQIVAAHQNHDYSHVPSRNGDSWKGSAESKENLALVKNRYIYLWELDDSDFIMNGNGIEKKPYSYRSFLQSVVLHSPPYLHWIIEPVFRAGHIAKYGYLTALEKLR